MNYQNFIEFKEQFLNNNSNIINLSENNLYKYFNFSNSFDNNIKGHVNGNVHRCHLVEDWLKYNDLEQGLKPLIGVSEGVRHSLDIISNYYLNKIWSIPEDVYPYYQNLMENKNINFNEYKTLNDILNIKDIKADILLITYPLKPSGRNISIDELNNIKDWLIQDKERRLIIDSVYLTNIHDLKFIINYFGNEQVYYLFSLSKILCLPKVFGLALIAEKDINLKEDFKKLSISKINLNLAYQALNNKSYRDRELYILDKHFSNYLKIKEIIKLPQFNGGYLFFIKDDFNLLLERGILSIPPSVFGSKINKGSIISTLI